MLRDGDRDEWMRLLGSGLERLEEGFRGLPEFVSARPEAGDGPAGRPVDGSAAVIGEVARRLRDNYPYFHPLYAGQMLKPPHPVAQAAYALAMSLNPNNHARDGGRASSEMEMEAVAEIAAMLGWQQGDGSGFLGHLTSGGTFANLEALWVAGQCMPGRRVVASEQAHYTHRRITGVLQIPFGSVRSDARGRMDLESLEDALRQGDVGTVVATLGTTALGAVDPLPEILALRQRYGFRLHIDAAYGGYFRLIQPELGADAAAAFAAMPEADSIVIDPHKHGLQPYGCGCVLFRNPEVGRFYRHDSPYTYFTSSALHLGEISLECSRAGASAVALWATQRLLPLVPLGEPGDDFARGLAQGRRAAFALDKLLRQDPRFEAFPDGPELDIVVWRAEGPAGAAQAVFDRAAAENLHLALVQLPERYFARDAGLKTGLETGRGELGKDRATDGGADSLTSCLRSVLMKPEHADWLPEIWQRLDRAASIGTTRQQG